MGMALCPGHVCRGSPFHRGACGPTLTKAGAPPPSRSQVLGTKGKGKVAPEGSVLPQTPGQLSG